jgi:hypothetical protein
VPKDSKRTAATSGGQPEGNRHLQKQLGRTTRIGRGKTKTGRDARPASQNGGFTWVDMIAGVSQASSRTEPSRINHRAR